MCVLLLYSKLPHLMAVLFWKDHDEMQPYSHNLITHTHGKQMLLTIRRMFPQIAYVLFWPVMRPVFSST